MLLPLALCAGCATRGNPEVLESRLRQYEDTLTETQQQLDTTQQELRVARRETLSLREQLAQQNKDSLMPEQANVLYRVAGVKLNPLLSGGLDNDGQAGDDLLVAMLVPYDEDGELLKLPGEVRLQVFDGPLAEEKRSLGTWEFTADECREHWHSGFAGSGFLFQMPWRQAPTEKELFLQFQLVTPDGRRYHNHQVVQIELPADQSTAGGASADAAEQQAKSKPPAESPIQTVEFRNVSDEQQAGTKSTSEKK